MSKIDPSLYLSNQTQKTSQHKGVLGKDDFLKLLITQLKNQDPMDPMKDKEYISQMATFTSLEQTQNMNTLLEKFVNSQTDNTLISQSNLIGKQISYQKTTTDGNGNDQTEAFQGLVKAVSMADGQVQYETQDGQKVFPKEIISIQDTTDSTNDGITNTSTNGTSDTSSSGN